MKKLLFFAIIGFITISTFGQTPNWQWANSAGGAPNDFAYSVASDNSGNIYATGEFDSPSITFGSTTLINGGSQFNVYLVKYDNSGNVLWAKSAGGTGGDRASGVCTDMSGNVYITGKFSSTTITFGTDTLTRSGSNSVFIAKYSNTGNVLWATTAIGIGGSSIEGSGVSSDVLGNVYITGDYGGGNIIFGTDTLIDSGVFVAKYDPNGNVLWAKSSTAGTGSCTSVHADNTGNVYTTGHFQSLNITFGSYTLTKVNSSYNDIFLVKYNNFGDVQWAKSAGGVYDDKSYGVSNDSSGFIYITGGFGFPSAAFDSITLTCVGGIDMFIAKYDPSGNIVWAKGLGGSDSDFGYGICNDALGNILMTGWTITGNNIVNKYDNNGNILWTKNFSGGPAYGICTDPYGNIIVAGEFQSGILFDTITLISNGARDIFVAKLGNNSIPPCSVSFQSSASPSGNVDFTATVTVSDSSAYPITYTWNYGDGSSATTTFDTISHIYNSSGFEACVTMQTANGCTSNFCDTVYLGTPCTLVVTTALTQPTPGQCDGSITAVASGGTPPYAYYWGNGATTSTITNLCGGLYYLSVIDAGGCVVSASAYLNDSTNTSCNAFFFYYENPNGAIQFIDSSYASSGITMWNWVIYDNLQNIVFTSTVQDPLVNLNAVGTYTVVLTIATSNGNSCTYTSTVTITGTSPCTMVAYMDITPVSVIGGNDGAIDLTVTGGIPGYTYLWSTGQTTQDISGLYSGNYTVMILDNDSLCAGISLTGYIFEPYDTTGGNIIIDTLTAPILDTCLNFVPDSFYISQIDIINNTTVVVTWVFEYQGQMQTIEVSYTFTANGNYMVTLTINCGSKALTTYSSYIHIDAALGVAGVISDENISVFPNPASSFFNIDATPPYNYTLTSISGQVVYSSTSEIGHSTVNSSHLPAGIYFVRIENAGNSYVSKIIITR